MCGFIGEISFNKIAKENIDTANRQIECRGPDEKNIYENILDLNKNKINLFLIFNRLSIVELTKYGSQPMYDEILNTLIMFNGEIFNHQELKREILNSNKGITFKSANSDTELLLIGLSLYGDSFVHKLIGQFSFIFIDFNSLNLMMCRDRLGQKPLYFNLESDSLKFSSNLKALKDISQNADLDLSRISDYLSLNIFPGSKTMYKKILKVNPGQLIKLDLNTLKISNDYIYWNPDNYIDEKVFNYDEFLHKLNNSIEIRSKADVPVASFLSGGVDSTSIVKNLYDSDLEVNTFSVIYNDKKFDESEWIQKVVSKYRTNHISINLEKPSYNNVIQALDSLDEPYADPSVVPSYLLCKEISNHYKVAISGDGGDELFGGYLRTEKVLNRNNFYVNKLDRLYKIYPNILGTGANFYRYSQNPAQAYGSYLQDLKFLKLLDINKNLVYEDSFINNSYSSSRKSLIASDYQFYLPELMMLKVDRTSMKNSLEVRSPFVDHRLVEYMLSTNLESDSRLTHKKLLKDYLSNDFGSDFVNRRKMGFVFNVKNFIFENRNEIYDHIELLPFVEKKHLKKLFLFKNRTNSNRLWNLFTLSRNLFGGK